MSSEHEEYVPPEELEIARRDSIEKIVREVEAECHDDIDTPAAYRQWEPNDEITCTKHGPGQIIVGGGSFIGFAGGRCYYDVLSCGCWYNVDESNDVEAAR